MMMIRCQKYLEYFDFIFFHHFPQFISPGSQNINKIPTKLHNLHNFILFSLEWNELDICVRHDFQGSYKYEYEGNDGEQEECEIPFIGDEVVFSACLFASTFLSIKEKIQIFFAFWKNSIRRGGSLFQEKKTQS